MRLLLVNVPHESIGSRIPDDHLPPLGLLAVGGPLIDAGHDVVLLDADRMPIPPSAIVDRAIGGRFDAVLFGHSGSTSAHPIIVEAATLLRRRHPKARIVYGGVFPTYHHREILEAERCFDVIVRGEGEATAVELFSALERGGDLRAVDGIAFREGEEIHVTAARSVQKSLDDFRIGWELIDFANYSYWGGKRAVVVQFSRGCPHLCNYCGQKGFWTQWRHRDPVRFAKELAWLHREHGVELVNFADENPTSSRKLFQAFLEALIAENVPLLLVGSTRADDIVRDADILHLYKKAGWIRFLLGTENTDEATLALVQKGGSTRTDQEAIRLLRAHGILSMATWVAGFTEETDADYWRQLRRLVAFDPDQTQSLYVTPHRWTPFFRIAKDRRVIQTDAKRWDYKHQVLATDSMPPWRVLLWVKSIELALQARPRSVWRTFFHPDPEIRHAMRWYAAMGRRVWLHEWKSFFWRDRRVTDGPTLAQFWGAPQDEEEQSMTVGKRRRLPVLQRAA
jgi:anaerobic magnesium-protoporphyrin IX monomethyl ester cyclase